MENKVLASYAVFSVLKNNCKSIYNVIEVFISAYLQKKKLYSFNLSQIVNGLNDEFNFKLPGAVISKVLYKMKGITKDDGIFSVDYTQIVKIDVSTIEKSKHSIDILIEKIYNYLCVNLNKTEVDKQSMYEEFVKYIMHESCSVTYKKYFASFLLENENDFFVVEYTNEIKEGAIIYLGITSDLKIEYDGTDNLGFFKQKMVIYLDTEILFHLYGLNGKYYKQQAEDFLNLVKEINKKTKYIQLCYFADVKNEIIAYYRAAEDVVKNGSLRKNDCAMNEIVSGCSMPSEITDKRTAFFKFLRDNLIMEDSYDSYYLDEKNYIYNIEGEEEVHPYLNYINILRKGKNCGRLMDIGFILVTGKAILLSQSWEKYWETKDIPRATTLDYLTEHFWFILNKGFGSHTTLKSFDTIVKAKIVLSSLIEVNLSSKFDDVCKRVECGEISATDAAELVAGLRFDSRKADELTANDSQYILSILSEEDVKGSIEEKKRKEEQLRVALSENQTLKSENETQKSKIAELENYKELEEERKKRVKLVLKRILYGVISIVFLFLYFIRINKYVISFFQLKGQKFGNFLGIILGILGFFGINFSAVKSGVKKIFEKKNK